jgi:hypothetical protein
MVHSLPKEPPYAGVGVKLTPFISVRWILILVLVNLSLKIISFTIAYFNYGLTNRLFFVFVFGLTGKIFPNNYF